MKQLMVIASGDASSWFDSLSDEQKQGYVKEHPNSKYAKNYRKKQEEEKRDPKNKTDKDGSDLHHADKQPKRLSNMFKQWVNKLAPKDREFFDNDGAEEGSRERRKVKHAVKEKSFDIVKQLKHQGKEWHTGIKALHKVATKKQLNDHDKEALKAIAKDTIMVMGTVALGGGLAHGVLAAMTHFGVDLVKDCALKAISHAVVEAGAKNQRMVLARMDDEDFMQKIVEELGNFAGNGHIPDNVWEKVIKEMVKKNNLTNDGDFDETLPDEDEDGEDDEDGDQELEDQDQESDDEDADDDQDDEDQDQELEDE